MNRTWSETLREPQMIIALVIQFSFVALIVMFGFGWAKDMDVRAKEIILQTYVAAFTASWMYWIGSSAGSKSKDKFIEKQNGGTKPTTP